jgi:peptide subunit release factor 1 (eRF1)
MATFTHMTDLELRRLLQELAVLRAHGEPIVTLTLDMHWSDEQQRERARVSVREMAKHEVDAHDAHPQREALVRTLARVVAEAEDRIQNSGRGGGHGLAIFACEALNLWRVVEVPQPLVTRVCTGMRPQLLSLARLLDDAEPAIVAMVTARGATLYEVALGGIVSETTVEGFTPVRHGQGGRVRGGASGSPHGASGGAFFEREQKNQRHVENFLERNRRAAIDQLVSLLDRGPARTHLVLVGAPEMVAAFERDLPPRAAERVIGRLPRPPSKQAWNGHGRDAILQATVAFVAEQERRQEHEIVENCVGQALRGGLAVVGTEDVVLAVNERRVHRLVMSETFTGSGWMCRNCDAIGVNHVQRCAFCEGELAWVKELNEELASRVLADDGQVEIVPRGGRIDGYGGVGAQLRQATASRGLGRSEASAPRA